MQNPPPVQTTNTPPSKSAKSSTGLDENVAALLSYVMTRVSGLIFFFIEKDSRLVRFHDDAGDSAGGPVIVLWHRAMDCRWVILAHHRGPNLRTADAYLLNVVIGLLMFVFYMGLLIAWILA